MTTRAPFTPPPVRSAVALAAMFVALACASCADRDAAPEAAGSPVVPVRVAALASRNLHDEIIATGQWRTTHELVVAAPFGAYVESLSVEAGDPVERGRVLGMLVTHESRAAVLGAEQLVASADDRAGKAEAGRALAQARRDLVRVPLVASAGGTVIRRTAARGAEVAEGAELFALAPRQSLVFEAHVPAADAARVRPGQAARVLMEDGTSVVARVTRRLPQAGAADQSALVWLESPAPPASAIDRYATSRIVTGGERHAIAVPDSALVEDDLTGEVRIAVVSAANVATWTTVKLGPADGAWRELLFPTLPAGTRVVTSGQRGLPDSTRVSIAP
jgi:multidrug efflux pump subunit AcrA (membrane-fusion protein)